MAVVPAAGTQDGGGGQGGVVVLADPTPVAAGEDFTPWDPAHANRLLSPGEARTVLGYRVSGRKCRSMIIYPGT